MIFAIHEDRRSSIFLSLSILLISVLINYLSSFVYRLGFIANGLQSGVKLVNRDG